MASKDKEALTRRSAREACWSARDAFMVCLDKHKAMPIKPDASDCPAECEPLRHPFTEQCMSSWVKYFMEQRLNKKQMDLQNANQDLKF